jgi:hypothetical protein
MISGMPSQVDNPDSSALSPVRATDFSLRHVDILPGYAENIYICPDPKSAEM